MKRLAAKITRTAPAEDTTPEVDMGEFHLETTRSILNEALYELIADCFGTCKAGMQR